ncbi:MAG: D-alanyl-D-alanine carboxypeptidase family protein, partial [Bradymonadaceae bacterium]
DSLDSKKADEVAAPVPLTPKEILAATGLEEPPTCMDFSDPEALQRRTVQWREAVAKLAETHPDLVISWIIGESPPPELAIKEAELQKDCMLSALILEARENRSVRLVLNYEESFSGAVDNARQLARRFETHPRSRRRVLQHLTRSAYRDAASQAHIWYRKHTFNGHSFNIVSEAAGERCGIASGQTWKPEASRHVRCWRQELNTREREREILAASAAPGISRHHWGTEFDILSLNPHSFTEHGPLRHDYAWLDANALDHGFFQPFKGPQNAEDHAHMEERWHWSYYPIAQALLEFVALNDGPVDAALNAQWDALEARWNRRRREPREYFPYIREHWRTYLFGIVVP